MPRKAAGRRLVKSVVREEQKAETVKRNDRAEKIAQGIIVDKGGREAYHNKRTLKEGLDDYFRRPEDEITPAGLLLHLGIDRKRWNIYESKPNLRKLCGEAQLKIEHYATKRLYSKGRVADIFMLKQMGWKDKMETETKETVVIGEHLNDEQEEAILARSAHRRSLLLKGARKEGGTGADSQGGA